MSNIFVNNIKEGPTIFDLYGNQAVLPVTELRHMTLKTFRSTYRGGAWLPSTSYSWMPNGFVDYTPASGSSKIRFSLQLSYAFYNAHCITHNIFYANGVEQGRHSISGYHQEHRHLYVWQVNSWGTFNARIGYQSRTYGGSNQGWFHTTGYWDGVGSNQLAESEIYIEEFLPIP